MQVTLYDENKSWEDQRKNSSVVRTPIDMDTLLSNYGGDKVSQE